ncbi:hypothetical protein AN191_16720 [Loktanella sp. 5RATIMAR09]|uniref:NADH:ubiquinone reductase (Na(+)-transporting) subunit F n=1 Tax=Loktanella sp. 5RATIMAR09 TaxID=1225655 RepID=UPI0006EB488D|nr:NADH:ubiquinone reductase (Na(+)-transporting) subunit F [Loktanella sp. 5RATIMAR09]KQI70704.1 hypothetical protein AN191_16720 [Loktanella sp. 5RATIMAR09]
MTTILLATFLFVALVLALSAAVLAVRRRLIPEGGIEIGVNGGQTITGAPGTTLLDALVAEGVALPAACGGKGTCGLCRVHLRSGGGPVLATESGRLSAADLRKGARLACQIRLREPLEVEVDPAFLDAKPHAARVASVKALTPTIKEIVFDLPDGWDFDYVAGDFVLVHAPAFRLPLSEIDMTPMAEPGWAASGLVAQSAAPVTRAYSVANRPEDTGRIVFNIRLALPPPDAKGAPPGVVSSWLFGLKPGDMADLSGPFGEFRAQDTGAEMVFVGGGVGMAPLRAVVADELARGSGRRITYFYGARGPGDLFYAEEHEAMAQAHDSFTWIPVLTEANAGWAGETGFVHEALIRRHLDIHPAPETCEYYLCGPPMMIRAVTAALDRTGVERRQIFYDDFGG